MIASGIRSRGLGLALGLFLGCGGKSGTLTINMVVSPSLDPFAQAAQVRITIGDTGTSKTFAVTGGHFDVKLDQKPDSKKSVQILVEALDGGGLLVGYGQSAPVLLAAADQTVAIWVGRPGKIDPAATKLTSARAEMAAIPVPSLGLLLAGGRDASGAALNDAPVYDTAVQAVLTTGTLSVARAGGSPVVLSTLRGAVFGGSAARGFGVAAAPSATIELFDPTINSGLWSPVGADMVDARSGAPSVALASGGTLIAGGTDASGMPLGTAALVSGDSSARLAQVAMPMVAKRRGHVMAAAMFPEGPGALLFGGADTPNCERFVGSSFLAYPIPGVLSRTGAAAVTLAGGNVAILGGRDTSGLTKKGLLVKPDATPTVIANADVLSVARENHTATLVGQNVLVCGGLDASGAPLDSCDLLDGATLALKATTKLAIARSGHAAGLIGTGTVVIAGGFVAGGAPTDSVEIYTPTR